MRYTLNESPTARRAIVLGASEGSGNIGDAISQLFGARGWTVFADDCWTDDGRPRGSGNAPSDTLIEHGYEGGPISNESRYRRHELPSFDQFERWDAEALIITLGTSVIKPFSEVRDFEVRRVLEACLLSPLEAVRRYVQSDRSSVRRSIVFIGSYSHDHVLSNSTAYCAAKAGLDMATRALAWELTDQGYRVHCVHPYHVPATPLGRATLDMMENDPRFGSREDAEAYQNKDLKMPEHLSPEDIAEVIYLLIIYRAMQYLGGAGLNMYGGTR